MKIKYLYILLMVMITTYCNAQDAKTYYEAGIEKGKAGNLNEAVQLLDKAVVMAPGEYLYWKGRGTLKCLLKQYNESLTDFSECIKLKPDLKDSYLSRGAVQWELSNYQLALEDFTHALHLDPQLASAYYNRG